MTGYGGLTRREFADLLKADYERSDTTTDYLMTIFIVVGLELTQRARKGDAEADRLLRETVASARSDMARRERRDE